MSARKKREAGPVKPVSAYNEIIAAISLVEVAMNSLECGEVGTSEQITLKQALKSMWLVHDRLDEIGIDDSTDDDGEEDE